MLARFWTSNQSERLRSHTPFAANFVWRLNTAIPQAEAQNVAPVHASREQSVATPQFQQKEPTKNRPHLRSAFCWLPLLDSNQRHPRLKICLSQARSKLASFSCGLNDRIPQTEPQNVAVSRASHDCLSTIDVIGFIST